MGITVMLFGHLAELAGKSSLLVEDAADAHTLQERLQAALPALATTTYRIAVNKKMVTENTSLSNESTVALLPPFSGG